MPKILFVGCDGTLDSPEYQPSHVDTIYERLLGNENYIRELVDQNLTQGWKINRYLDRKEPDDKKKIKIISYYDAGLGIKQRTKVKNDRETLKFFKELENKFAEAKAAVAGEGIINNVANAYYFLTRYYEAGDQIFCAGFSRGSYTLFLLNLMIRTIGLINIGSPNFRENYGTNIKQSIADGFACYERHVHPDENKKAIDFANQFAYQQAGSDGKIHVTKEHLIHFLGLFDNVPGLIPERVPHNHRMGSVPKFVRNALAIDEQRPEFAPVIGQPSIKSNTISAWFAGVHSDIGGAYRGKGLSNCSLQWMLKEAIQCGLPVHTTLLNAEFPEKPLALQHNSLSIAIPDTDNKVTWKDICRPEPRPIGVTAAGETIHPSSLQRIYEEVPTQNANGEIHALPYCPPNLVTGINALRSPKNYPEPQQNLLLFNAKFGYQIPYDISFVNTTGLNPRK